MVSEHVPGYYAVDSAALLRFQCWDPAAYAKNRENSRKFPGHFPEISRKFPGNFPEISRKFPGNFPEISRKFPGTFPDISRNFLGKFPDNSWKCTEIFPEKSRKFPGNFRRHLLLLKGPRKTAFGIGILMTVDGKKNPPLIG